ncbi:hypothetical protein N7532_009340 [Penicillium argentinense]|uniref:RGS domain-containing protein n=1 Tax=Penicillium argentinense TaxID=1131581 RepID=A0A9W9EZA5_9EURO|nr:uncharacterized protein N7532_009340 [Penicillium argentinense]KAJ5090656.1 hypothetical protein N7532_009340 [Penicillium argentinense]
MPSSHSGDSSIGVTKTPATLKNLRSKSYEGAWWPSLDEVLNNTAPPPYSLSAFMKYLSQNHCVETLEFVLEAKRYCESYKSSVEPAKEPPVATKCSASIDLNLLYRLLLKTYILPGAAREVNLPVKIRDDLLKNEITSTPPSPETLDAAVRSIQDLIEDSIFVSFLNSLSTCLYRDTALSASAQDDSRAYLLYKTSDSQSTERVQTKRPSLMTLGRSWSWPPWSR